MTASATITTPYNVTVEFAAGLGEAFASSGLTKAGLGFLVKASKAAKEDSQQTAWHSCTLKVGQTTPRARAARSGARS